MDQNSCRLSWPQGGAYFNNTEMAGEIRTILEQALADTNITRHDEEAHDHTNAAGSHIESDSSQDDQKSLEDNTAQKEGPEEKQDE